MLFLTISSSVSIDWSLLDRDHALVADLFHRSSLAIILPISGVAVGGRSCRPGQVSRRWVATFFEACSMLSSTTAFLDRHVDAMRLRSSGSHAGAGDRLDASPPPHDGSCRTKGQHGRGQWCRSPAASLVREATCSTICAHHVLGLAVRELGSPWRRSIRRPWRMRGAPYDLARTTLRPWGPSVTFHERWRG